MLRITALCVLLLGVAERACAHPEITAALERLSARLATAPGDAELHLQRGELYAQHGDAVMAEANFLRAAELSPRLPRLDRARGSLALVTGGPGAALVHLDRAIALDPADAEARVLRSRALARCDRRADAATELDAALALLAAPSPELLLERAALCADPADTVRNLERAIARAGPLPVLLLRALELDEKLGRDDAALARIETLLAQSENKAEWRKRRGDVLQRAGRAAEARADYLAAQRELAALPDWLRASPGNASLADEIARLVTPRS